MTGQDVVKIISQQLSVNEAEAALIVEKSIVGGEIVGSDGFDRWLSERFLPNCVMLDEQDYSQMCIDALKILSKTAATDFGGSRQRDLGQLWADMTRGYLGELAFKKFLSKRWKIDAKLGHEKGELSDYLPMDIHMIRDGEGEYRVPKLKVGIKAVKWNGIWFDIPGDQFAHSDIHVLVKVGTARDHLFAFFKQISVFKDKILKRGEEVGSLTKIESEDLFRSLPSFRAIPAYICGFVGKTTLHKALSYSGKKGRMHYTITAWNGPIASGDLEKIKSTEGITGKVSFKSIVKFAHDNGYLFNTGNLLWNDREWEKVRAGL